MSPEPVSLSSNTEQLKTVSNHVIQKLVLFASQSLHCLIWTWALYDEAALVSAGLGWAYEGLDRSLATLDKQQAKQVGEIPENSEQ